MVIVGGRINRKWLLERPSPSHRMVLVKLRLTQCIESGRQDEAGD